MAGRNAAIFRRPLRVSVLPNCRGAVSNGRPYRDSKPQFSPLDFDAASPAAGLVARIKMGHRGNA